MQTLTEAIVPEPIVRALFDPGARAFTYLLIDRNTRSAVIVDPVLEGVDRDLLLLRESGVKLTHILETHLHADHITGAGKLRAATGARIAVSAASGIRDANLLLEDASRVPLGASEIVTLATPGHTPGCVSYYVEGMVFTGDCMLVGGTGRTDLPGGSAERLFDSIVDCLFSLPAETQVLPAHEYRGNRSSTIGREKRFNPRIGGGKSREEFVGLMRDLKLALPARMAEAIRSNLHCGGDSCESRGREPMSLTQRDAR
jgi:sulfur dioxygenase